MINFSMDKKSFLFVSMLLFFTALLSFILFVYGESGFLGNSIILWELRFPKIATAFFAGGMLASAGLLLQVFFQNPLAGPDLLGINAGASLGVAIVIMGTSFLPVNLVGLFTVVGLPVMAMLGALAIFFLLTFLVQKKLSKMSLLILGLLIASFTSSFISVLINMTSSLQVKNFLVWAMGSFQGLTKEELPFFLSLSILATSFLFFLPKQLNQFIMGESYAKSMGVDVGRFKVILILICSFLVAIVTAFCGPIGFIGVIAPHIARNFIRRSDLRWVMPAAFLVGSFFALFTELILVLGSEYSLNTNSILGLIGAPIIALYLYREKGVL